LSFITWLLNGERGQIETAAALLEGAPKHFVFDQLGLVEQTLEQAGTFGQDCQRRVANSFLSIAISGTRSGPPGQPYPQDITLRDLCQEALPSLPRGGATFRLFQDVLRRVEQNIEAATHEQDEDG
jgi:hypothetical protein